MSWILAGVIMQVILWTVAYHTVHFKFEDEVKNKNKKEK